MAMLAPRPSASVATATIVRAGRCRSRRQACVRSSIQDMWGPPQTLPSTEEGTLELSGTATKSFHHEGHEGHEGRWVGSPACRAARLEEDHRRKHRMQKTSGAFV